MKQLTHRLKDGKLEITKVPPPILKSGQVLVRNHYSLISSGTESSTVSAAKKGFIGKAKERPKAVKQAVDVLRQQGPVQAYRVVSRKLDALSPLGYSSAGEVIGVGDDVKGFAVGDLAACAGPGAAHAEIVAVPVNLCVKLYPGADLKTAAFTTLGAVALQGVRQADLRLGETAAVIGLGLLGQLTGLILRAGGIRAIGIDISQAVVDIARVHSADAAFLREEPGLVEKINELTGGIGCDAVVITAASESRDPVNLAGRIARQRSKVIIVGAVSTDFDRDDYYHKELDLRMSRSYGPGRHDPLYEEKGVDYPAGYVRWTEKRNMEAFRDLIESGKIDLDFLITHTFGLEEAPWAYDLILEKKEASLGMVIAYDVEKEIGPKRVDLKPPEPAGKVSVGFIGAGGYASGYLLPNLPRDKGIVLKGVLAAHGTSSRTAAEKYGFEFCTADEVDIFSHEEINTVFIATRHDSHARYVLEALKSGKNVFVEKPLCLTGEELRSIEAAVSKDSGGQTTRLMVGFNRRFAPLTSELKKIMGPGPLSMIYRINAGAIPADSWIQDRQRGGGRIIGEACHFIDYLSFVCDSVPGAVYAVAMKDAPGLGDTLNISLTFADGSIGSLSYFANGGKALPKEYVEVYGSGMTAVLRDFRELEIFGRKKDFRKKLLSQDKGQKAMLAGFIDSIKKGLPCPIPVEDILSVTRATFNVEESLRRGEAIKI